LNSWLGGDIIRFMHPTSPAVRQIMAAQYAEDRRAAARSRAPRAPRRRTHRRAVLQRLVARRPRPAARARCATC
jgi:hypothetical protein